MNIQKLIMSRVHTLTDLKNNETNKNQTKIDMLITELTNTRAELNAEIKTNGKAFTLVKKLAERIKKLELQLNQERIKPLNIPSLKTGSSQNTRPDWDTLTELLTEIREEF